MYFVSAYADILVSIVRVILEGHTCIHCYQLCKLYFAPSKALDGISCYLSVNFLTLLSFCYYIHTRSSKLLDKLSL